MVGLAAASTPMDGPGAGQRGGTQEAHGVPPRLVLVAPGYGPDIAVDHPGPERVVGPLLHREMGFTTSSYVVILKRLLRRRLGRFFGREFLAI